MPTPNSNRLVRIRRVLKPWLQPVVAQLRSLPYRGHGRSCSCCGKEFRRFRSIGSPRRPDAECPYCRSRERHRLLALVAVKRPELFAGRVLHFAPEPSLTRVLRPKAAEYVTTNINDSADVKADITQLPFPPDRWDCIICSHVLEHVVDDRSALSELRRVLAPEGKAIVMVPRIFGRSTDEDPSVTDPQERLRRFGQSDHVRTYGDDLEERITAAGFTSMEPISLDMFTAEEVERYRLRAINAGAAETDLICG